MIKLEQLIPNQVLKEVFGNSNFGAMTKRDVIRYALLKVASNFQNGHTSQVIIEELGLCIKTNKAKKQLTLKGQEYLYAAFHGGNF